MADQNVKESHEKNCTLRNTLVVENIALQIPSANIQCNNQCKYSIANEECNCDTFDFGFYL